jgi:ssDNA-binding protein
MVERVAVYTPPFRVSFPNVFRSSSYNGGEAKYSLVMLFYPANFNEAHKKAWREVGRIANEASIEKFKKPLKELPDNFRKPFRKGEEKAHLDGYGEGCIFFTASSKQAPGVVDRNKATVLEQDLYPGCWARASVTAFAYDNKGKGVSFGLHNIQKLGEGESFSGRIAAEEDFGDNVDDIFPDDGGGSSTGDDDNDPMA